MSTSTRLHRSGGFVVSPTNFPGRFDNDTIHLENWRDWNQPLPHHPAIDPTTASTPVQNQEHEQAHTQSQLQYMVPAPYAEDVDDGDEGDDNGDEGDDDGAASDPSSSCHMVPSASAPQEQARPWSQVNKQPPQDEAFYRECLSGQRGNVPIERLKLAMALDNDTANLITAKINSMLPNDLPFLNFLSRENKAHCERMVDSLHEDPEVGPLFTQRFEKPDAKRFFEQSALHWIMVVNTRNRKFYDKQTRGPVMRPPLTQPPEQTIEVSSSSSPEAAPSFPSVTPTRSTASTTIDHGRQTPPAGASGKENRPDTPRGSVKRPRRSILPSPRPSRKARVANNLQIWSVSARRLLLNVSLNDIFEKSLRPQDTPAGVGDISIGALRQLCSERLGREKLPAIKPEAMDFLFEDPEEAEPDLLFDDSTLLFAYRSWKAVDENSPLVLWLKDTVTEDELD